MAIKLVDELKAMGNFPIAHAEGINLVKTDGTEDNLQNLFDNGELGGGGGDSSVTLTQQEYEALSEEQKLDGLYYTYDTKRIYKNGVQYGASDAEDIGYNNAGSGIQATTVQGAIDKVVKTVEDAYAKKTDIPTTLPANGGNADTVNNHTVKSDVPENAKFTDTVYDDTEIKAEIAKNGTPVGCIFPFAGINFPRGYLLCNGASYKVADYPDLYAVIGNTYGGDTENFNVPDYRETVLVGVGENTTDTIASHDVYGLGEFKDDQLQRITGDFEAGNRNTQPHTSGAFSIKESPYTWYALSETATSSSNVEFDSSKVTRSGTTTHGKQKGVTYIIKAR